MTLIKIFLVSFLVIPAVNLAQVDLGEHNGCSATDADFSHQTLATLNQDNKADVNEGPLKLAFRTQADGKPDVYVVRKGGDIYKYNGATEEVTHIATLDVISIKEDGLVGMVFDPGYDENNKIYLMYSHGVEGASFFRISSFIMEDDILDKNSEKVMIETPISWNKWHTGGSMHFDRFGDLWISIGDNEETEFGPGNTADFKGSIIRIRPDDNDPRGYTIPAGNFAEHFIQYWEDKGELELAAEYGDADKVLPELYVKGLRNPYTLAVDPKFGWLAWGDVGPDGRGGETEEHNLVTEPGFMGWAYWAGDRKIDGVYGDGDLGGGTKEEPVNNFEKNQPEWFSEDYLTGVNRLPPVQDPTFARPQACAMTGPVFRYDGSNPSPTQFPPQFDGMWMSQGCDGGWGFRIVKMNDNATMDGEFIRIFNNGEMNSNRLVDLQQGPDGALYYLEFGSKELSRIEYTGTCKDETMLPLSDYSNTRGKRQFSLKGDKVSILVSGPNQVSFHDVKGHSLYNGSNRRSYTIVKPEKGGVYFLRIKTTSGSQTIKKVYY